MLSVRPHPSPPAPFTPPRPSRQMRLDQVETRLMNSWWPTWLAAADGCSPCTSAGANNTLNTPC
ncbi:hypothetical protein E2C01_071886 [Portunus trituberculatus]|uniref:Uncharacterized protein n=1 Tax=Portunus trituberculatus TaxID=210409 RepID=A0A5B7I527_PORTR|nr:hypothetical protein [Portunus trituberculatus]